MESLGLDFPLLLETVNDVLVVPAEFVGETLDGAVLAARLEAKDTEGLGHNHLLFAVVRGRNTLVELDALKSSGTTGGLVRDHAADSLVKDARGGTEVEGTLLLRVDQVLLVQVSLVAEL